MCEGGTSEGVGQCVCEGGGTSEGVGRWGCEGVELTCAIGALREDVLGEEGWAPGGCCCCCCCCCAMAAGPAEVGREAEEVVGW